MKKTVVIGMSGGVDSSVSALLLKEQGHHVIGVFMKNWEETDEEGVCAADQDYKDVIAVASMLDIPYYQMNFSKEYWDKVFARCLDDFKAGHTPNPDILCNKEIKFKAFFEKAKELGADFVATGHYCQNIEKDGRHYLVRGVDCDKDQTYFLYTMQESVLKQVLFPIGHLKKKEVRELAKKNGLITAEKKDSTGICFIGKRDFRDFLSRYITKKKGALKTLAGVTVGEHEGVYFYTIGQRKGLGIGGKGEAWYVIGKDVEKNIVYVEQGDTHPELYLDHLTATEESWVNGSPELPFSCTAKIRYRAEDVACTLLQREEGKLYVQFDKSQKAITSRQSIVFYDEEVCLGGAIIV